MAVLNLDDKEALRLYELEMQFQRELVQEAKVLSADCYKRCAFIRRIQSEQLKGEVDVVLYDFEVWADGDQREGLAALLSQVVKIEPAQQTIALRFQPSSYSWLFLVLEYSVHHCWTFFAHANEMELGFKVDHDDMFRLYGRDEANKFFMNSGLAAFFSS